MTRVFVADDHELVRAGLRGIIEASSDMTVCGEAGDGNSTIAAVQAGGIDVVLVDLSMPGKSGLDLVRHLRAIAPRLPILVLSMHSEDQFAVRAIRTGASGYLNKDSAPRELLAAIRKVARGGLYVSAATAEQMALELSGRLGPSSDAPLHASLSPREHDVFIRLVEGWTVSDIASHMNLSIKTVSTHKQRLMEKLKCATLVELGRYAMTNGVVASDPGPQARALREP